MRYLTEGIHRDAVCIAKHVYMKTKERDEWVEALRTGGFDQSKHVLQDNHGFCCLGVACEIFKEDLNLKVEKVVFREGGFEVYYDYQGQVMPQKLADFLGLTTREGLFTELRMEGAQPGDTLTSLNDSGATFTQIADILEEHEDILFNEIKNYG